MLPRGMIIKNVSTACTHCGLPVPSGLIESDRAEQFCCNGCSAAWQLIHSSGLDSFYRMVDSTGQDQSLQQRKHDQGRFCEFDEPGFLQKFATQTEQGTAKISLAIDGIHCAACVWLIEKLPTIVAGIIDSRVNWSQGTVTILWQPNRVGLSRIAAALNQLGYTPHPIRTNETAVRRQIENRRQLTQVGIAAAAAGNNMLIAAALYFGMFSFMSGGMVTLFRVVSCLIGLASFLGPGRVFLRGAISAIKTRTPHMDLPIAVALTAGTIAGLVNTVRGSGEIYFDSLSVLICLLLVGRWIQFRQQNQAADAIELLYRMTPARVRKIVDGKVNEVAVDELSNGDLFEIRPGDLVAADGVVVDGHSQFDEAILTGESRPATKRVDDPLSAGTKNLNSSIVARVLASGCQTRISKIVELVEQAVSDKPEIVQWANRIGGHFVVIVLLLAFATFVSWLFIDSTRAVDRAVALLIVACPCALAMATPLAISVALGRLAKRKILVKAGDVLQSLSRPGIVWLDKTGTLTDGNMQVVQWHGDERWLPVIASIESQFNHPVATAFTQLSTGKKTSTETSLSFWESRALRPGEGFTAASQVPANADNTISKLGHQVCEKTTLKPQPPFAADNTRQPDSQQLQSGVKAQLGDSGILIGNRKLIDANDIRVSAEWDLIEANILQQQHSPCWLAIDGEVAGLAALGDAVRADARPLVDELKQLGWAVGVLSGDHPEIVNRVADQLGIQNVRAGATPEEKLAIIRASSDEFETTVMVGDGVNDSAALAAATVGIAVHHGAEASLAAAPVYLGTPGLAAIRDLLASSKSATRTIRINFAASLGYNILGVTLAMAGWLNPLVAAILMPISSLTVISLSINAARR